MSTIRQVYGERYNHFTPPPEIVLTGGVRSGHKYNIVAKKGRRQRLSERDGEQCRYCSATTNLTIEHLTPKSRGGSNDDSNLALSCNSCNHQKSCLDDEEYKQYVKIRPECRLCGKHISAQSYLIFDNFCSLRCEKRLPRLLTETPVFARLVLDSPAHQRKGILLALNN